MPIPKHLRHFYSAAAGWPEKRAQAMARAGGRLDKKGRYCGGARCPDCGKPDLKRVITATWKDAAGQPAMAWRPIGIMPAWRDQNGQPIKGPPPGARVREILVVITVGHLNHISGDDRPENLRAMCQWHHCMFDRAHHAETRSDRKDARRPILEAAS